MLIVLNIFLVIVFFFLGASVGSFINLAVYRVRRSKNFSGRSFCDKCKKTLTVKELIPVFSYLFYKGKCSCAKYMLPKFMLFVEVFTGILFVGIFLVFSLVQVGKGSFYHMNFFAYNQYIALFYWLIIVSCLVFIFIYDFKYLEIPYSPVFIMVLFWVLFNTASFYLYKNALTESALSTVIGKYLVQTNYFYNNISFYTSNILYTFYFAFFTFLFFLFLFLVTKGKGMGFGDVYTAPVLALIVGFPLSITFLLLSFIFGATYGVIALAFKKAKLKTAVPFAPFMILSVLFCLTFGNLLTKLLL